MKLGLRGQVVAACAAASVLVVAVVMATAAALFVDRQQAALQSRTQAIGDALAVQLERILALDIALHDLQGFDEQCNETLQRHAGLSFAAVVDPAGRVLFRSRWPQGEAPPALPAPTLGALRPSSTADGRHELVPSAVHAADGRAVAVVIVGYPRELLHSQRNALLAALASAAAAALVLTLLLLRAALARVLVQPLGQVLGAVRRMGAGDREAQVQLGPRAADELAVLAQGFNQLVQTVSQREGELLAARDAAEQANRAKTLFLAVMSHELRTPLNGVIGMADVLARTPLDERQQRLLGQVRSSGRQLSVLIADLLDLASIEAGQLRVTHAPFALAPVLTDCVERHRDEARRRGLSLGLELDPSLPERIVGDSLRVQQVLGNLLSNALKFTEQGGVQVRATPSALGVRVAVADTGIGIEPEFLPHVYEAFRQADSSLTRRFGGSGLGLSIARSLCQAMGGSIDVLSRPGKGTTFWFDLPLRPHAAALPTPPVPDESPAWPALPARTVELLLVEDHAANRDFVAECLRDAPCRLTLARDGTEGLSRLVERRYDAVLLDLQLPGIDGLSLLQSLRAIEGREGWPRAPVLVLTAHATPEHRHQCLAAGVDQVLTKPFTGAQLRQALAGLLAPAPPLGLGLPQADQRG